MKKVSAYQKHRELLDRFSGESQEIIEEYLYSVFEDLAEHLIEDIYGFAYRRGIIDIKTRHLITIGILSALGDFQPQLRFQLKAALNLGIKPEEVKEAFIQTAVFAGNARAINAAMIFHEILQSFNNQDNENLP